MSLRDSYFNGSTGVQQQMDAAFASGIAYVGTGVNDISTLSLGDRNGSNLSAGPGNQGLYFSYATPSANYVFWISINSEVAPAVSGTIIQVVLLSGDTSTQVAAKISAAMNTVIGSPFQCTSAANVVSMQNTVAGIVILPVSVGTLNYTHASYSGTIAGTSTAVVITANTLGPSGAAVVLTFTGSNSISSAISTWNTANPSNAVTLTSGDGTQIPSVGTISPSGGQVGLAAVAQYQAGVAPTGAYSQLMQALMNGAAAGQQDFRVLVQGTGAMNSLTLRACNGNNLALRSFFAGIYYALAGQQIYSYQVQLLLDISTTSSTNVIFRFTFNRRFHNAPINLEPLNCASTGIISCGPNHLTGGSCGCGY